jgi:signal transduction histidine kinase
VDCPPNAFQVTASQPAIIDALVRPLREVLLVAVSLAIVAIIVVRARRAGPMLRRALIPLAVTLILRDVSLGVWFILRGDSPESTNAVEFLGWFYMLSLALVAAGFGIGLLLRRLYAAIALEHFVIGLPPHPSAIEVRDTLRHILDDPSLRLFWKGPGQFRWLDEQGDPVSPPDTSSRHATSIEINGEPVALVVHDEALAQDRAVVRAAARFALTAIDNDRLVADLQSSLLRLSQSRARTAVVADETRRRIERDLHDGAQQRLVALRIKLSAAAEDYDGSDPVRANLLRALGDDVEQTLDELRQLAHGIYPAVLTERGLHAALSAVALASPIPTSVRAAGAARYRPEVESAVYFACMEALQNAAKHAHGASGVTITLSERPTLNFEVRDDGDGFTARTVVNGNGLTNLRDRMAAIGGEVEVRSIPGEGTTVTGVLPAG